MGADSEKLEYYRRIYQSLHGKLQYAVTTELATVEMDKDREDVSFKEALRQGQGDKGMEYGDRLRRANELHIESQLAESKLEIERLVYEAMKSQEPGVIPPSVTNEATVREPAGERKFFDAGKALSRFKSGLRRNAKTFAYNSLAAAAIATMLVGSVGYKKELPPVSPQIAYMVAPLDEIPSHVFGSGAVEVAEGVRDPMYLQTDARGQPLPVVYPITAEDEQYLMEKYGPDFAETLGIKKLADPVALSKQVESQRIDVVQAAENSLATQSIDSFRNLGAEVTRTEQGEVLIRMPVYTFELFYGGEVAGGWRGSEWYENKEHNAEVAVDEINTYFANRGGVKPGEDVAFVRDIYRFSNPGYVEGLGVDGSGACWPVANFGATIDRLNAQFPIPVIEIVEAHKHKKAYMSYTFPEDRYDQNKWDGGYTVYALEDGVAGTEFKFRINPEVESYFPGYRVVVDFSLAFHWGTGAENPSSVNTQVMLKLIQVDSGTPIVESAEDMASYELENQGNEKSSSIRIADSISMARSGDIDQTRIDRKKQDEQAKLASVQGRAYQNTHNRRG